MKVGRKKKWRKLKIKEQRKDEQKLKLKGQNKCKKDRNKEGCENK
jgi:hypothetical protein